MMDLYGNGLLLGEKTLDSLWMRQNLTMNNIANVDTPGFKSQYMTFENELAQKIRSALTVKKQCHLVKLIGSLRGKPLTKIYKL